MVASRGGYRMARGRHYAKLSLSNAARLSFSDLCILLFMFLSLCRLCVCVFLCSHWSLVDVPLIFFCPADHVPDWQPRVLLGMVEARSVNVKKTTTTTTTVPGRYFSNICFSLLIIFYSVRITRPPFFTRNTALLVSYQAISRLFSCCYRSSRGEWMVYQILATTWWVFLLRCLICTNVCMYVWSSHIYI